MLRLTAQYVALNPVAGAHAGDAVDSELMATIEENNDTLDQGQRAMDRRAYVGLSDWEVDGIDVDPSIVCTAGFNRNGCQCCDCVAFEKLRARREGWLTLTSDGRVVFAASVSSR